MEDQYQGLANGSAGTEQLHWNTTANLHGVPGATTYHAFWSFKTLLSLEDNPCFWTGMRVDTARHARSERRLHEGRGVWACREKLKRSHAGDVTAGWSSPAFFRDGD